MWLRLVTGLMFAVSTIQPAAAPRYLALGDSYTIGEGVAADENWPHQLVAELRAQGVAIADPEIIARTGWTTDELSAAMDTHTFHPPYALVTLLIGVNNQYRGRDIDNYRTEFRALLERAIALADGNARHVVVVSIPDWGATRFGADSGRDRARIARDIDAFNAANAQISTMLHVQYANVTAVSRARGGEASMLVADGLHPSVAMYRRWLDAILPPARSALTGH